jgi:hypothetical protein
MQFWLRLSLRQSQRLIFGLKSKCDCKQRFRCWKAITTKNLTAIFNFTGFAGSSRKMQMIWFIAISISIGTEVGLKIEIAMSMWLWLWWMIWTFRNIHSQEFDRSEVKWTENYRAISDRLSDRDTVKKFAVGYPRISSKTLTDGQDWGLPIASYLVLGVELDSSTKTVRPWWVTTNWFFIVGLSLIFERVKGFLKKWSSRSELERVAYRRSAPIGEPKKCSNRSDLKWTSNSGKLNDMRDD